MIKMASIVDCKKLIMCSSAAFVCAATVAFPVSVVTGLGVAAVGAAGAYFGSQRFRQYCHGQFANISILGSHPVSTDSAVPLANSSNAQAEPRLDLVLQTQALNLFHVPDKDVLQFLEPNERIPVNVRPHLLKMQRGLIVSVGTERSFFDLLLSDPNLCTGLVVRDVNPRVKAYVDFNTLLLTIATSRLDYRALIEQFNPSEIRLRINLARDMPAQVRNY